MRATYRLLLSALLTIVACTSSPVVGERPAEPPLRPQVELVAFALQPFDDCDALLDYLREHALERVTPWGLEGVPWGHMQATGDGAATFATAEADTARAGVDYSITNVQELGVDEPDLVKTDGERILVVAQGRLHYVDVTGEEPTLRGSLALEEMGWSNSLFLDGDTALLMGMRDGAVHPLEERFASYWPGAPVTILAQVDLSDPDDLRITRTLEVDGGFLSARLTGGVARVVLSSYPTGLAFV
ncbi:MAG: beta-propeller domain-containing protein, partial [Acidimicrobiia bacterium]